MIKGSLKIYHHDARSENFCGCVEYLGVIIVGWVSLVSFQQLQYPRNYLTHLGMYLTKLVIYTWTRSVSFFCQLLKVSRSNFLLLIMNLWNTVKGFLRFLNEISTRDGYRTRLESRKMAKKSLLRKMTPWLVGVMQGHAVKFFVLLFYGAKTFSFWSWTYFEALTPIFLSENGRFSNFLKNGYFLQYLYPLAKVGASYKVFWARNIGKQVDNGFLRKFFSYGSLGSLQGGSKKPVFSNFCVRH